MKIKRKQMLRLKEVLSMDRRETGDDFFNLLEKDLASLFAEYFDFNDKPVCKITDEKDGLRVEVSLTALRIKPFGSIPK